MLLLKFVFTYLLALGVIAGMTSGMLALDSCETAPEPAVAEHSHGDDCCPGPIDEDPESDPCTPHEEGPCQGDHHHHHVGCTHVMPLLADLQTRLSLNSSDFSRLLFSIEDDGAPETPVYEMDKPPLI